MILRACIFVALLVASQVTGCSEDASSKDNTERSHVAAFTDASESTDVANITTSADTLEFVRDTLKSDDADQVIDVHDASDSTDRSDATQPPEPSDAADTAASVDSLNANETNESASHAPIKMDGFFDDWHAGLSTYIDASSDSEGLELLAFSVSNDSEYLYVTFSLDTEIDLTEPYDNPAEVVINIDADNNPGTGLATNDIGAEYRIDFFNKSITDYTDATITKERSLYDLGIVPLPTITSDAFEIAIRRARLSDSVAISIHERLGNDRMPNEGMVFTYDVDHSLISWNPALSLAKHDSSKLRLMTYNVRQNGLTDDSRVDAHRRIFTSVKPDIIALQECGNTSFDEALGFLSSVNMVYPHIYPYPSSGNITLSNFPSLASWQVGNQRINADLLDLPDATYTHDILLLNAHLKCCGNNQSRQESADALIQFIHDAKTVGGVIDLAPDTPIVFAGDMNLVGYAKQYDTIVNGTISDTDTFGLGGPPDWDDSPLKDQVCFFNEKNMAYTWDKGNPSAGDYPPGRLDFVFFSDSVMSVDKCFVLSTEHMSEALLSQHHLLADDTKQASDHFPIIVDFSLPMVQPGTTIQKQR